MNSRGRHHSIDRSSRFAGNPGRTPLGAGSESPRRCLVDASCHTNDQGEDLPLCMLRLSSFPDVTKPSEKLCRAIENGDVEFCRCFLSHKVDWTGILLRDGRGRSKTNQLPFHTLFLTRHSSLDSPVLQLLLDSGLDLNLQDTFGRTALHCLINRIHSEQSHAASCSQCPGDFATAISCIEMLARGGANIDCRDGSRQTPLHLVAFYNIPSCVRVLLELGANPDARDINGNSPLHVCAMFCHTETLAVLMRNGANPALGNARGETPLHIAARNYARSGFGCVKLLLTAVCDVNQVDAAGNTPLHLAVSICTQKDIISRLLSRGADPDIKNALGQSALFLYLNSKLVEQQHHTVLRPSRLRRIQLPDLGKSIMHSAGFCLIMDHTTCISIRDTSGALPRLMALPETAALTDWLLDLARNPRSLLFLCRQTVRKAMRPYKLDWPACKTLGLPKQLEEYVLKPVYQKDSFAPWSSHSEQRANT
ncbi:ankyrin repeat domain-containing protein 61-like [Diadema setosum]|uniref:ankyrin repeat domain-containing protein 61-like n=1 Tax=Diadema setosum TaxID=31175 RepID=UPI003B3A279D